MNIFNKESIEKFGEKLIKSINPLEQELIDKYIIPRGGIHSENTLEYAMIKTLIPSLMIGYENIPRVRPLPKVNFEVVKNANLNAIAIKTEKENDYLVLVNSGLIKEIISFIEFFINSDHNLYKKEYETNKNWFRSLFYQVIIEHEFSHIFNGHLGLIQEVWQNQTIEEQRDESKKQEYKFLLQTLEMDADCTGLSRLYGWLINHAKIENHPMVTDFARNPIQSFSDLIMSFYVINKFYYDLTSLSKDIGQSTHLTPRERIMGSFGNVLLAIKTYRFDINPKDLMDETIKKINWVENIFLEEYGIPYNQEFWENEEYLHHTEVTLKVLHNWTNIQPGLLKHNYIPIVGVERDLKINDWYSSYEKSEQNENET